MGKLENLCPGWESKPHIAFVTNSAQARKQSAEFFSDLSQECRQQEKS